MKRKRNDLWAKAVRAGRKWKKEVGKTSLGKAASTPPKLRFK